MTRLLHRTPRITPPYAVSGQGIYIEDREGRRYIGNSGISLS